MAANAWQCFLSIRRPLLTLATIYWGENGYFWRGKGCQTSQLMPVYYLSPRSNMFSLCQNYGCGESSIDTHTRTSTQSGKCTSADKHTHPQMPSLSVHHCEKSDAHPSACVIPSNKCRVAVYPHQHVNQVLVILSFIF